MSTTNEGNVIRIPIEIAFEDKEEWKQMIAELEKRKSDLPAEHKVVPDKTFEEETGDQGPEKECECTDSTNKEKTTDENELNENAFITKRQAMSLITSAITNPGGLAIMQLAKFAPELLEVLAAAGLIELLLQKMFAPGGPLDIRFKRDIPNEVFNLFSREEQQARRIGTIQVIGTSVGGFRSLNGNNVENTFREIVTNGRVSRIGLQDKSNGWNGY